MPDLYIDSSENRDLNRGKEDENFLVKDRTVIQKSSNGKRKVSTALLTPWALDPAR